MLYDLFHGRLFKYQPNDTRKMIYMLIVTTLPLFGFVLIMEMKTNGFVMQDSNPNI